MAQNKGKDIKKSGQAAGPRIDNDQLGENRTEPGIGGTNRNLKNGKKTCK